MVELAKEIANSENTQTNLKRSTVNKSFVSSTVLISSGEFTSYDGPLTIEDETFGHSFVLGSTTNGVLGVANGEDGEQIVLGKAGTVLTTRQIINEGKVFTERFETSLFEDTGVTTADWGDTEGELVMTTGEIAQSESVAYKDGDISKATITLTLSSGSVSDVAIQLTADGGSNWENVSNATQHSFANVGEELKFKLTASGSVTITKVRISYVSE
jgi:hypothetical protein